MPTPELAFVALGSNVGDREAHLESAREHLAKLPNTSLAAESTIAETKPLGPVKQGKYLNQMVLLRTELSKPSTKRGGSASNGGVRGRWMWTWFGLGIRSSKRKK